MELKILKLKFENITMARRDIPKIRGFIANTYPEYDELHNHKGKKYIYRYPLIQYKVISGMPIIMGINEGADILSKIEDNIENLNISGKNISAYKKEITYVKGKLGACENFLKYKFITPWMALNEKNYKKYNEIAEEQKSTLIKSILIGNILSMCKRFGYNVENELKAFINLQPCKINFKNQEMVGFKGEFIINFYIPDYMAIGKSVSRGFGTVKLIESFE